MMQDWCRLASPVHSVKVLVQVASEGLISPSKRYTMSVVPPTGIVRKHYVEAHEDIEYKSSAFWQAWLQRAFFELDSYSVTGELLPGESLGRVDIIVKRYDSSNNSVPALLWVRCRRPSCSIAEAERQVLDAAMRCIATDNLRWIYGITTVGVSFRSWFVEREINKLVPIHGTAVSADRTQYIDADSEDAWVLARTIALVKGTNPPKYAPVLPGQSVSLYHTPGV